MPVDNPDESRGKMRNRSGVCQTKTGLPAFTKVFAPVKKSDLRAAILAELKQELLRQTQAAQLARDEAISEESRAENKWDTHSQEAAYLAEGQARLAAEIGESIKLYETLPFPDFTPDAVIAVGAIVKVEAAPGRTTRYFIGPRAGGLELRWEDQPVLVLTPQSPLGRQFLGKRAGDTVSPNGRAPVPQRIVSVQ